MFAERFVIPEILKHRILLRLHKGHPGQEKMKSLAKSYVYWKYMDADIQDSVMKCSSCAETAKSSPKIPFFPWSTPKAEQIDIPPNLSTELIPGVIPDHVVHGSQQEIEVSTDHPREVRPSRMKRIPSYLKDFELRRGDVGTT
ncbi:hypothetical protein JTB14_037163 [Gonioctena quinquepunctata]|nr:hypothetical protein JTB14_037163 [Gonioctena quinquepunctata]